MCSYFPQRFISKSGKVNIRSKNETNFVGASKELKQAIKSIDQNSANKHLVAKNINLKLTAPISPCLGSIWESLVESGKRSQKVIIRDKLFTEEHLSTVLCEVESVNSKSLHNWQLRSHEHSRSKRLTIALNGG